MGKEIISRAETAFIMDTSRIKFGIGVTSEIGEDIKALNCDRVMVLTDPNLSGSEPVSRVLESLKQVGIDPVLFDQVRVEPTNLSFQSAIDFAYDGEFDGFVAVGGGSSKAIYWDGRTEDGEQVSSGTYFYQI